MKKTSKLTVFIGRLFFIPAILACSLSANAVEIGSPESIAPTVAAVEPVPAIQMPAGLSLGQLPAIAPTADQLRNQREQPGLGPIKAVVLDMDGVTTPNSGALWTKLGQQFLRSVAPGWSEGDLRHIKWKSLPDVHRWITENRGARLEYGEYVQRREALSAYIYGELAKLEPTLLETRDVLKAEDVSVALASANTRFSVDSMIRRFHLERTFDAVASSEELPADQALLGKSQTHLLACRRLGVPPNQALAIEDTAAGVEAARKAGLLTVGLRNGLNNTENFSSAHAVVRQIREILPLLEALNSGGLKK